MAKKKRKRPQHRHPVAPPVHSAPAGTHVPLPPPPTQDGPSRPMGAEPPSAAEVASPRPAPKPMRQTPGQKRAAQRRRNRVRNYAMTGLLVAFLIGALVFSKINGNKAAHTFDQITTAAGCGKVKSTGNAGGFNHLAKGERTTYDTSPPSHGAHDPVPIAAGIYDKALSDDPNVQPNIYQAVHSLEHGAVIVWYDNLSDKDVNTLETKYADANKVIVVPYPKLSGKTHVALTSWGRLMDCPRVSTKVIDAYIKRFRESKSAPEPKKLI